MEVASSRRQGVTAEELREAERGLLRLLYAKHFPREWIERHVPEVMAQAQTDFAVRLAAGREDDTVNLLVVIAYRRALKVLRAQRTRPGTTSIETILHLADESTPTPEQEALDHDRQERLVRAMAHLPDRDRQLLALVYFEEMSVREAGRRLGWGKSSADRHHRSALQRLRALVGERSLLSPEIAIPAFIAAGRDSFPRTALRWIEGASETIREATLLGGTRAGPLAETGNAAAIGGAGRVTAGACSAAVVACMAAASGVVGPGIDAIGSGEGKAKQLARPLPAVSAVSQTPDPTSRGIRHRGSAATPRRTARIDLRGSEAPQESGHQPGPSPERSAADPPRATAEETVSEFGIEPGDAEPSAEPAPRPVQSPPARSVARPAVSTSPSSPQASGGSRASSEFGM